MLVFWNFSRTGLPSLSLLLSLRAGEAAAFGASSAGSCCSVELILDGSRVWFETGIAAVAGCVRGRGGVKDALRRYKDSAAIVVVCSSAHQDQMCPTTSVLYVDVKGVGGSVTVSCGRDAAKTRDGRCTGGRLRSQHQEWCRKCWRCECRNCAAQILALSKTEGSSLVKSRCRGGFVSMRLDDLLRSADPCARYETCNYTI